MTKMRWLLLSKHVTQGLKCWSEPAASAHCNWCNTQNKSNERAQIMLRPLSACPFLRRTNNAICHNCAGVSSPYAGWFCSKAADYFLIITSPTTTTTTIDSRAGQMWFVSSGSNRDQTAWDGIGPTTVPRFYNNFVFKKRSQKKTMSERRASSSSPSNPQQGRKVNGFASWRDSIGPVAASPLFAMWCGFRTETTHAHSTYQARKIVTLICAIICHRWW